MNILILGGTGDARDLAARLVALGHRVTTSLAGRTRAPILPAGANGRHGPVLEAAAASLPSGATVLVTSGHDGLELLLERDDCHFLVRLIEPPDEDLPRYARLLLSRPPYNVEAERALLAHEGITHLITKNSGGTQTDAKLEAARLSGVEVIMIDRPAYGPATEVGTVDEALAATVG